MVITLLAIRECTNTQRTRQDITIKFPALNRGSTFKTSLVAPIVLQQIIDCQRNATEAVRYITDLHSEQITDDIQVLPYFVTRYRKTENWDSSGLDLLFGSYTEGSEEYWKSSGRSAISICSHTGYWYNQGNQTWDRVYSHSQLTVIKIFNPSLPPHTYLDLYIQDSHLVVMLFAFTLSDHQHHHHHLLSKLRSRRNSGNSRQSLESFDLVSNKHFSHGGKWIEMIDDARVETHCPAFAKILSSLRRAEQICNDMVVKSKILH